MPNIYHQESDIAVNKNKYSTIMLQLKCYFLLNRMRESKKFALISFSLISFIPSKGY